MGLFLGLNNFTCIVFLNFYFLTWYKSRSHRTVEGLNLIYNTRVAGLDSYLSCILLQS